MRALGLLLLSSSASSADIPRIVVLLGPDAAIPLEQGLLTGLGELGYRDGQNLAIEWHRQAYGPQLKEFAIALAQRNIQVVVVWSTSHARAILENTTIPVVYMVGDPIGSGLAASLARPGGRGTGISNMIVELTGKRMEILHELAPQAKRVGVLFSPWNALGKVQVEEARKAALILGLNLKLLNVSDGKELDRLLASLTRKQVDAVLATGDLLILGNRKKIARALLRAKVPAIFASPTFHDAGVLASYGPDIKEAARKLATYVVRILKGANPGDLPVEQMSRYELIINERIAKEIGLPVPQALLMRADRLIK